MQEFERQAQAFASQIEDELQEGRLNFPTALDVSLRIKRLADNPESTMEEIAAAVRAEPVLSAKAVRMANAVLLNPYGRPVTSVNEAVKRIGLSALRCLAFAVAAEQLAQDHRSRQMRLVASGLWMHSVDVAAWSYALARHLCTVRPDTAMLAGIMIDIGQFFLLARAADYPALEENMSRWGAPFWKPLSCRKPSSMPSSTKTLTLATGRPKIFPTSCSSPPWRLTRPTPSIRC
jgi:HD-like signal output (HDOD) protein